MVSRTSVPDVGSVDVDVVVGDGCERESRMD